MNTTQVPTEWLKELISLNRRMEAYSLCQNDYDKEQYHIYIGKIIGHIKASKYFQPQPDSVDLSINLEEFNKWVFKKYVYNPTTDLYHGASNMTSIVPFSEVLQAFKKSKGL